MFRIRIYLSFIQQCSGAAIDEKYMNNCFSLFLSFSELFIIFLIFCKKTPLHDTVLFNNPLNDLQYDFDFYNNDSGVCFCLKILFF